MSRSPRVPTSSHTANTVMAGYTTPADGMTPSLTTTPTSRMISYVSVANPGITPSVVSLLSGYLAPPDTASVGGTNQLYLL
jgi:hypothetical protein